LNYGKKNILQEEKVMQRRKSLISNVFILTFVGMVLSGIILVDTAKAGPPPLKVTLALPSSANLGQVFNISITVTNKTNTAVNINKVAVGYALQVLRVRGPYEIVGFNPQIVPGNGTKTFTVPFAITDGSGTVVGLSVILANGDYTEDGLMGSAFGGVKIN
jgi:hypothetical protein